MNYLSVENVSKAFGERLLFKGVSFGLEKGQKTALIAKNGTGKSTLFNILEGNMSPDTGEVVYRNDIKIAFLKQDHGLDESLTIFENLFVGDTPLVQAIRAYEHALNHPEEVEALQQASEKMDQLNAWEYETNARQILGKLEIHDLERDTATLSGGQKRRIALAKVLVSEPDLILLDEPTNHLDLDMIEWLEEFLTRSELAVLMVTHDRYFLERICTEIIELDDEQMFRYKGNFSYYLEKKAEREEVERVNLGKAKSLMKKELDWIRKQPKARGTKSKSRVDAFDDVKAAASKGSDKKNLELEINIQRLGNKIIELHKVRKSYGDLKILDGFDYVFQKGERVGIVGKNGTGKTTFLQLIQQHMEPDGGKVVIGDTIRFGYYAQSGIQLKDGQRIIEAVREIADVIPLNKGRMITAEQMLERFMFPRKRQWDYIEKLSGGEKKRLHLLTVLMKNPNFLILDEPTNDLDIFTLSALEDYLEQYPGCLVVVSHDRYFMDKLVDHILYFKGEGEVKDILGNYQTYRNTLIADAQAEKAAIAKEKKQESKIEKPKAAPAAKKLGFKEKYELDQIDQELPGLEVKKKALEEKVNSGAVTDHEELTAMFKELGELVKEIDQKTERWLELSEME